MRSRRDVLGALGTAAVASAAGCFSTNTEDTDGVGGDTDTIASFHDWLGPGLFDVSSMVDSFARVTARYPKVAMDNDHLAVRDDKYLQEDVTEDGSLVLPFEDRDITLDVDIPDLEVTSKGHAHQFWLYSGSFDADVLSEEFADATIHEEYRDHQIVAEPLPDDMFLSGPADEGPLSRCVAFNDHNLIIAHIEFSEYGEFTESPESRVTKFARTMLDTHAGAADRFVETNEEVGIAADEFGDGWYTQFHRVGREILSGYTIELDGDTAIRRGIKFFETEDEAADFWWLDEDLLEEAQEPPDDDEYPVPVGNIHEEHDEVHARQEGRYVMLEATLSADEIVLPGWDLFASRPQ